MKTQDLNRILFVEDESDIQAVARLALEAVGGFSVRICSSGAEALQVAPAFAPHLILLDVMMPGMDGPNTLKALRELADFSETPVVFMTAKIQPHERRYYEELGAIGVIPKPFDPMTLSSTIRGIWGEKMANSQLTFQEQFAALKDAYARGLPEKLNRLTMALQQATAPGHDESALASFHRAAHSLAGSGASLGFARLSEAARKLELCLQAVVEKGTEFTSLEKEQIETLLAALYEAAGEHDVAEQTDSSERVPLPGSAQWENQGHKNGKSVFLYEMDGDSARDLAVQVGYFGYDVRVFDCWENLKKASAQVKPFAVIAVVSDISTTDGDIGRMTRVWHGQPPVIFVSALEDLNARLLAVRAGGVAYFTSPVSVDSIVSKLDQLATPQESDPFRILVVDDEPELAAYHASILESAGMLTTVISDPMLTLTALLESKPDLILVDMHMPGCTGLELAAVIRQQEAYVSVPIVYLSAETNIDKQLAAMRQGGDSFLTKPIRPEHLISAVWGRVERLRVLRSFMVRDSLTGLLNHTVLKEQLAVEVARAARLGNDMSFVMVDIDHFKLVNDTYGHPTGDQVMKSISRLLQQRLRKSDVVGRYGGEEFAIILPNTTEEQAAKLLDELRVGFSQVRHQSEGREFYVTFSAGIASCSNFSNAGQLSNAADRALYKAKAQGRNRVITAGNEIL